jgi:hypothetical protein
MLAQALATPGTLGNTMKNARHVASPLIVGCRSGSIYAERSVSQQQLSIEAIASSAGTPPCMPPARIPDCYVDAGELYEVFAGAT